MRLVRLLAPLAALLAATFTHAQSAVAEGTRTGVFHMGNGAEPRSLDPHINVAFTDTLVTQSMFEGLVLKDPVDGKILPGVAERWSVSDDGLVWTFHLRHNAKWSDGHPLNAHDFVWSFRRNLSPRLGTEYSYMLWCLVGAEGYTRQFDEDLPANERVTSFDDVGVRALDDFTLELRLIAPTPYLLSMLTHDSWMPVPRHVIEPRGGIDSRTTGWDRPGTHVGNGPFRLVEWSPNRFVRVERNPHYWDNENTGLNGIVFYPIEDTAAEERAYLAGQLHRTYKVLSDSIERFKRERPDELHINPWMETYYLRFNVNRRPFNDPRVRQALSLAIDRQSIVDDVTRGGQVAAFHFTPPNTGGYTARARVDEDITRARQLLREAGFPNGRGFPRVVMTYNTDPENARIMQAIQAMWRSALNIRVELAHLEFKSYVELMNRVDFDILRSRWIGDYDDPKTYLDMFVTAGGNNNTNWSNADYDRLIREASRTTDPEARFELFQQAEEILLRELPVTPIFFGTLAALQHPSVRDFGITQTGQVLYKRIRLE